MANGASGIVYEKWWYPLLAIPPSLNSSEYLRLRRLWWDQTRVRKLAGKGVPEFYNSSWETHLTAVLWENFAFLSKEHWFNRLLAESELKFPPSAIEAANWSYGWEAEVGAKRGVRIVDIVLSYRDMYGKEGVIVVEVKRPNSPIANDKDLEPSYYLDLPRLRELFERRSLLYIVSDSRLADARRAVRSGDADVGFLSWERLAAIQMQAALCDIDCPERIRCVVAAAIHRQFLSYGIKPAEIPREYLKAERSWTEIAALWTQGDRQSTLDRRKELFRLPKAL